MATLFDEQGNEVEAFLPEEVEKEKETLRTEYAGKLTEVEQKLKDAEESANPNWGKARTKITNLERIARDKGFELDDEGNPIGGTSAEREEIIKEAQEAGRNAAREEAVNSYKDELLGSYDKETREVIEHYFNKLAHGEELSVKKVSEIMKTAIVAAGVEPIKPTAPRSHGRPPEPKGSEEKGFAHTPEGEATLRAMGYEVPENK